jgi:hypothetical protein
MVHDHGSLPIDDALIKITFSSYLIIKLSVLESLQTVIYYIRFLQI